LISCAQTQVLVAAMMQAESNRLQRAACTALPQGLEAAYASRTNRDGGSGIHRDLSCEASVMAPHCASCRSTRHTRHAAGRPWSSNHGFGRVQRHRNDGRSRQMQRHRDRAKYRAANERCSDNDQLFHERLPSVFLGLSSRTCRLFYCGKID
jgi:hypothetical protein